MFRLASRKGKALAKFQALAIREREGWRPTEVDHIACTSAGWRAVGASAIGSAHQVQNTARQDAFAICMVGEAVIAVCADGLSSASQSHVASTFAVEYVKEALKDTLQKRPDAGERMIIKCIKKASFELAQMFTALNQGKDEKFCYYTTIIGVVIKNESGLFFNHGDGAGIAFTRANDRDYSLFVMTSPEHGEFSGQVFPLLEEGFQEHFRVSEFSGADRIIMMTDGVAEFALNESENGPQPEFISAFDEAMLTTAVSETSKKLCDYLLSDRANAASPDDKTLVWIERRSDCNL